MSRSLGLLQSIGAALSGALSAGRGSIGCVSSELVSAQRTLGTRWLSAAAPASGAAAPRQPQPSSSDALSADQQPSSSGSSAGEDASAFNVGFRRVVSERRAAGSLEGVIHIQNTLNNIILTLTDKTGAIKTYTSAGVVGFRGSRKSQPVAAERAAEELARRALKLGFSTVAVRLKGPGNNKQYAVQSLAASGLTITSLADVTGIPYNGCRPPKKRRV